MRLLFLSKQCPQNRDLLTRPYGRFFHLPRLLAEKGHEVHILLLSYDRRPAAETRQLGIRRYSRSLWNVGASSYWSTACALAQAMKPDWIIGFSDTYFGIMAEFLGRRYACPSMIDAYDNYESYLPWCTPLHFFWRRAVSNAAAVTAAGPQLADLLQQSRPEKPVYIIPMAADSPAFVPLERIACRRELNLPPFKTIIGYCGSIHRSRGIDTLLGAYDILKKSCQETDLVLTGRMGKRVTLPDAVKWLGYLQDEKIPIFLNSLNVSVVSNRISSFGSYSYPVKLYEAMKCQIPVIATDTPPANWILKGDERFLARPDDPHDLADKIRQNLTLDHVDYGEQTSWEQSCKILEEVLLRL